MVCKEQGASSVQPEDPGEGRCMVGYLVQLGHTINSSHTHVFAVVCDFKQIILAKNSLQSAIGLRGEALQLQMPDPELPSPNFTLPLGALVLWSKRSRCPGEKNRM